MSKSQEEKLEWLESTCINTLYTMLNKAVNSPGGNNLHEGEIKTISLTAQVLMAVRTGKTGDAESALVSLATANIKEKYQ